MADLSLQTVLGITLEPSAGTYNAPSLSDLVIVADLKPTIDPLTADIREYTGSIHRPGPVVLGKTFSVSGKILLRGPGGASPPGADTWVPGRVMRAAGFSEVVTSAAVPATPESTGGGTTTQATLGASGSTTDDIYVGLLLLLSSLGANRAGLTPVRDYVGSTKAALLAETAGGNIAGNWQLPKQLSYVLSTGAPPTLSVSCWVGKRRYNGVGCAVSSFKINLPASSRDSQDVPSIEFTLTGDFYSAADDATPPSPPAGLAVPPFRDGKLWVSNKQVGGSSVSIDLGAQIGYAPNPNRPTGNEAAQLTETTRTVDMTLNQVALTTFDDISMSDSQGYYPLFALWGLASGNAFGLLVSDMRFAPRSPDNSGALVAQTGQAYIDGANRTIALSIPFGVTF